MPNPAVQYEIIAVHPGGRTSRKTVRGAPGEGKMISWAKPQRAVAVIRYYPSRKGWRVLDIRNAIEVGTRNGAVKFWQGQVRGMTYFPNEDAAVMAAIHALA